jgi:hypothetical protein
VVSLAKAKFHNNPLLNRTSNSNNNNSSSSSSEAPKTRASDWNILARAKIVCSIYVLETWLNDADANGAQSEDCWRRGRIMLPPLGSASVPLLNPSVSDV